MRFAIGAKKRKPWSELFFDNSFNSNLTKEAAGNYALPLEMLRLSPSAANKQPWKVLKSKNRYDFYLNHTMKHSEGGYDMQMVDMGIAMCHFELTLRELGLEGRWEKLDLPSTSSVEYVMSWMEVRPHA